MINLFKTTKNHSDWWIRRKIDWKVSYRDNWNHPHRFMISKIVSQLPFISLIEIGVGGGANLINIIKHTQGKQVGGVDVSEEAIALCQETFKGGFFKVGSAEDIPVSDDSADIVLTDMTLIYVGDINKAINEIKRVSRNYIVLCELHSPSWYAKMKLKWTSGYYAYDYKKLLSKHGFEDIELIKIPTKVWDGKPQKPFGFIIIAKTPRRK